jgi:hypothetical protein
MVDRLGVASAHLKMGAAHLEGGYRQKVVADYYDAYIDHYQ